MFACVMIRQSHADPRDVATGDRLIEALTPFAQADLTGVWTGDRAIIAQALTWNTPESKHETAPTVCPETGRVIASWVRLDNREDLCTALKLENRETLTDPQIILEAHRTWGADCADRLEGDFSFVVYDPDRHEAFCARDTFGTRPFFYCVTDDVFVATTTCNLFTDISALRFTPTSRWALSRLQWFPETDYDTPFDEVKKLAPAHTITLAAETRITPVRYFAFDTDAPVASQRDDIWVEKYRDVFFQAVDCRLRSSFFIAAESSGGLDSSSIVARAANKVWHGPDNLHCFGFVEMSEEHEWVLRVAADLRIKNSHILVRPSLEHPLELSERLAKVLGYPPENDIPYATAPFFQGCQTYGARTLLSGFGGDEFVTNHAGDMQKELLSNGQYGAFLKEFDLKNARSQAATLVKYFLPRYHHPLGRWLKSLMAYQNILLRDEFVLQPGKSRYSDLNNALRGNVSLGNRQLHDPIFSVGASIRLEECSLVANSYSVDMAWPLFDRRLVAQYLRTPSIEKRKGSIGRYLHRRAVSGTIPHSINWKRSKALGNAARWSLDTTNPCLLAWEDLPEIFKKIVDPEKLVTAQRSVVERYDKQEEGLHRLRRRSLQVLDLAARWLHTLSG